MRSLMLVQSRAARAVAACTFVAGVVACGGGGSDGAGEPAGQVASARISALEDKPSLLGPVDYGASTLPEAVSAAGKSAQRLAVPPAGGPQISGRFLPAVGWPLVPIHIALLPDGRTMSYGTDAAQQTGQFNYEVWDPNAGTGTDAHLVLPNVTGTDLFCSGQIVLPRTGEVLMTGGDVTINGKRNYSSADINFFDYLTNSLRKSAQTLAHPRWYPSVVTLTDGSVMVMGGRDADPSSTIIATPEVYNPDTGWRSLTGATNDPAYGTANWYYPRAWTAPNGRVFVAASSGRTFYVNPAGSGSIVEQSLTLPVGDYWLPDVMFEPGKILSLRRGAKASVINLNGKTPTAAATAVLSQERLWANATVLANGQVLVSGGSRLDNQAVDIAYHTELWNPATGTWTIGASATRMRLYHSTAMLLPDGRVLTAGGGAPGPVTNLNAEIYEPPYLFKTDGSANYAARPVIQSAPLQITWGSPYTVQMADTAAVSKVVLIKTGAVTHSNNFDQRYLVASFTQAGNQLTVQAPTGAAQATPGNYLLFAFDSAGVPAVAKIVRLAAAGEAYPNSIKVRAKATLAGGVGPTMQVRIAGSVVGSVQVTSTAYQDYTFALPAVAAGGATVEIVYTNDATIGSEDRNLYVQSVTLNRMTMLPTDTGVVFDRGSGAAAFDNLDVVPGTTDLTTNGALRFAAPGTTITPITVRARSDIAEDVGAMMQIRVNGNYAGNVEVRSTTYTDYVLRLPFALPPGTRLDVVFINDGSVTGDRNLYVESVTANGVVLRPTDPGVTVDIGSGSEAFDGVTVLPGQADILWNAALRFRIPDTTPPDGPKLTVRAKGSLAAGVGPMMHVLVADTEIGAVEVRVTAYNDYTFALPSAVAPGARVDVVFDNDAGNATEDRNLYVESITVNGATILSTAPDVSVDIGSGAAAFDGVNTLPGQTDILWNAALRFKAPDASAASLTVRAQASLAAGVGPYMHLLVGGVEVGAVEVKSTTYADVVFPLSGPVASGVRVDVVFDNDGVIGTEDRNLYVESITVNGATILSTAPGVSVDIGSGAAAFDGVNTLPGQTDILWNAALRFVAP